MRITPVGYSNLGTARNDGIRYVWQLGPKRPYIESAAFTTRAKIPVHEQDNTISAYTTSVSSGCALTPALVPCKFCRTGNSLRFSGPLSAAEIAMQNILMVLVDMENTAYPPAMRNLREFAYMGQGEPGFSYTQLRQAIKITNAVLEKLGQKVFRHIVATCGVPELVDALMEDLTKGFYGETRITFHFSLHATEHRSDVMPINTMYDYQQIIRRLPYVRQVTGEKPCIGVLMFKDYCNGSCKNYSTDAAELERIANLLDPEVCRISLCEFNPCDSVGKNGIVTPEEANAMVEYLQGRGFEVKLFASFGRQENTACGLLGGTKPDIPTDEKMLEYYARAQQLIAEVYDGI